MILTSFIIYLIYNIFVLTKYSIPENLSSTYYKLGKYGWVFPVTMISCVACLIPGWLNMLEGSDFQFVAFLCPMAIAFMAMAPDFKSDKFEYNVHAISTCIAAILALFAIIFVLNGWLHLIFCTFLILLISITTRTLKSNWLYWLETIVFLSTYTSILI